MQATVLNRFPEATVLAEAAFRFSQSVITHFYTIITCFNLIITHYCIIITPFLPHYSYEKYHYYIIITSLLRIINVIMVPSLPIITHYYLLSPLLLPHFYPFLQSHWVTPDRAVARQVFGFADDQ